jgi:hypothetical protein
MWQAIHSLWQVLNVYKTLARQDGNRMAQTYRTYATGKQQCDVTWRHDATMPLQYLVTQTKSRMGDMWRDDVAWHSSSHQHHHWLFLARVSLWHRVQLPWATCWALGHNVSAVALCYKKLQRALELSRADKATKKKVNVWAIQLSFSHGRRVLLSGGSNHVNLSVHRVHP